MPPMGVVEEKGTESGLIYASLDASQVFLLLAVAPALKTFLLLPLSYSTREVKEKKKKPNFSCPGVF